MKIDPMRIVALLIAGLCGGWVLPAGAEEGTGIRFDTSPGWQAVLEKARAENKYIFVDCFTTWCGPCRRMEQRVFVQQDVGSAFSRNIIAVRLQMDETPDDKPEVRAWRKDANMFAEKYPIRGYPAFFIFSPQGELVKQAMGYLEPYRLIALVRSVVGEADYSTLKAEFLAGRRDYSIARRLVDDAQIRGEQAFAAEVARDYIDNWLLQLPVEQLYTLENLEFIRQRLAGTQDKAFRLFYPDGSAADSAYQVDTLMQHQQQQLSAGQWMVASSRQNAAGPLRSYSAEVVDFWVTAEEINPFLQPATGGKRHTVPWEQIRKTIARKYSPEIADRCVAAQKAVWKQRAATPKK